MTLPLRRTSTASQESKTFVNKHGVNNAHHQATGGAFHTIPRSFPVFFVTVVV